MPTAWSTAAPSIPWRTTPAARWPHTDGRTYVTQTSALHLLRNQTSGTIRANAYLRHRGRSTCLVSVDIVGEGGKLLATGEFTFFCVDKNILDEKAGKKD